ncbi:MAG: hypothetical protein ACI93R_000783 [Flavobacteriales bacterium]|jgi:hypothetical protein
MDITEQTTIVKSNTDIHRQITESFIKIELFFKGNEYHYTRETLPVSIGRDSQCGVSVNNSTASREHCTLELRNNQVGIIDSSTNGTYIKIGRSDGILIKNSFYPLVSQGHISLGEPIDLQSPEILHFRVSANAKTPQI